MWLLSCSLHVTSYISTGRAHIGTDVHAPPGKGCVAYRCQCKVPSNRVLGFVISTQGPFSDQSMAV